MRLEDIRPSVWDAVVEHMTFALKELEFEGEDIEIDWRIGANARKLDRELYDKYGYFKDIILNERFQSLKTWLQENVVLSFDVLVGEPVMPLVTAIGVLYIMYKRVSNDIVALAAAFLFNVNPLYVILAYIAYHVRGRWKDRNRQPKQYRGKVIADAVAAAVAVAKSLETATLIAAPSSISKSSIISGSSSSSSRLNGSGGSREFNTTSTADEDAGNGRFDHVLLGSDIGTLYTAALLARLGHTCCVLQPDGDLPLQISASNAKPGLPDLPPVPVRNLSLGKVERYQTLFDMLKPASSASKSRVTFAAIGTKEDGFTQTVIKMRKKIQHTRKDLWTLRAGEMSLASDTATKLALDKMKLEQFLVAITRSQDSLIMFLNSHALPLSEGTQLAQTPLSKQIITIATETIGSIYSNYKPIEPAADRSAAHQNQRAANETAVSAAVAAAASATEQEALEALGMLLERLAVIGSDELTMMPGECSGLGFAQALTSSAHGSFYPIGGPQHLADYLIEIIQSTGGEVRRSVAITKIDIEEQEGVLIASGVTLEDGSKVQVGTDGSIISGVGFLRTYEEYISAEDLAKMAALPSSPAGGPLKALEALVEASPRVLVLFWLDGTAEENGLRSSDFIDFGGSVTGAVSRVWSPSAKDPSWADRHPMCQAVVVELPVDEQTYVLNPLTQSQAYGASGPGIYSASSSSSRSDRQYTESARKILSEVYPRALTRVLHEQVVAPQLGGRNMVSLTTAKFSTPLSAHSDVLGLFFCGRDLATSGLSGEVQGGYVAACAVLGYTKADFLQGRNVASDLQGMVD